MSNNSKVPIGLLCSIESGSSPISKQLIDWYSYKLDLKPKYLEALLVGPMEKGKLVQGLQSAALSIFLFYLQLGFNLKKFDEK
ncbi:hypothetical protein QT397_19050 [Microbulbifer sp. MKSA007]|nr:hypothetical protein QT397_19050 [Microbulbifer sp. MKSA007]